jgi:hypothetical protein
MKQINVWSINPQTLLENLKHSPKRCKNAADNLRDTSDNLKGSPKRFRNSSDNLEDLPDNLKDSPKRCKNSPDNLKDSPDNLKDSPKRCKNSPDNLKGSSKLLGKDKISVLLHLGSCSWFVQSGTDSSCYRTTDITLRRVTQCNAPTGVLIWQVIKLTILRIAIAILQPYF